MALKKQSGTDNLLLQDGACVLLLQASVARAKGGYPYSAGASKAWLRSQFDGEIYDSVEAAIAALNAVEEKQTTTRKKTARKAVAKVKRVVDEAEAPVEIPRKTLDVSRLDEVIAAKQQLLFVLDKIEKGRRQREEDAVLALLIAA